MTARLTTRDFDPEVLVLFDAYVHGRIDRRGFLDGARKFATAGMTATGLLAALSPDFAAAQQVRPDDARLRTQRVDITSPAGNGTVKGYLCRPAAATGKLPAVVVIHENRGLNPHIEDIARRLALDGFMALAPDALTPLGGYPGDEDRARAMFFQLDRDKAREDIMAGARWLQSRADGNGKLGAVGFCWGGGVAHALATRMPELAAVVPFYGPAALPAEAARVKAALLVHFAEKDEDVNATWPPYQAALRQAGVRHTAHTYPGTVHGFNNDTTPRYNEEQARIAWGRTVAFFRQRLA